MSCIFDNKTPYCEGDKKELSLEENRIKYKAQNIQWKKITCYAPDKLFPNETNCDYVIFVNEPLNQTTTYLIELKGSDIDKAHEQLLKTYKKAKQSGCIVGVCKFRIVVKKGVSPQLYSSLTKKILKEISELKFEKPLVKTNQFEEAI